MRKVKPANRDESHAGFEHVTGCYKYFTIVGTSFLFWTGILPLKVGGKTEIFEFKLFSMSSLLAFVRLFIITFPLLILPAIFTYVVGFSDKELEDITGDSLDNLTAVDGLSQFYQAEYGMNFLIYVLPFAFAFFAVEPFTKGHYSKIEFQNMSRRATFLDVKQVLFPLMGLLVFALGKLLNLVPIMKDFYYTGLYINLYNIICSFFLAHLPLHLMLATYEGLLYQSVNLFQVMSSWTLEANDQETLFVRAKMLPRVMEGIQKGFGFFILVDVTLMLIYWLLHTYHAYFTFQVRLDEKVCLYFPLSGRPSPCYSIFSHHSGRVLESVFAL